MSFGWLRRAAWRHVEWWSLLLCAAAWVWMLAPRHAGPHVHAHHGFNAWMVMTLAMMLPLVVPALRATAARSFWARRHRAVAVFLAGYIAVWACAGVVAVVALRAWPHAWVFAAAALFLLAAIWQSTRAKLRALVACHRTEPLSPRGWRADRDCARFGIHAGVACVRSCWALMLACFVSGSAAVMIGLTAVAFAERRISRRHRWLLTGCVAVGGLVSVIFA